MVSRQFESDPAGASRRYENQCNVCRGLNQADLRSPAARRVDQPTAAGTPRSAAAAISGGCPAEIYEPTQQKVYTERDGEDVPAAQIITDCVKGVGHDDEQPDEHKRDSSRARHLMMVRETGVSHRHSCPAPGKEKRAAHAECPMRDALTTGAHEHRRPARQCGRSVSAAAASDGGAAAQSQQRQKG